MGFSISALIGRATARRAQQLEHVAQRAYASATEAGGVLTDWRASEAVLTPIDEVQRASVIRAIDEGLPVGVYSNRYVLDGTQHSELLPLTAGEPQSFRSNRRLVRASASRDDALAGAARLSYEAMESNPDLTTGPAFFVVDRSTSATGEFAVQQALLETAHGQLPVSLDQAVRLQIPKGAIDPQAVIARTQPRVVGLASSSGIATGFGDEFNEYAIRDDGLNLLEQLRRARA